MGEVSILSPSSQTCATTFRGNQKVVIYLSYWKARKMVRQMNFYDPAEFWAWTRSDKRPPDFPRDPDSFYSQEWHPNGGIKGFLGNDQPHNGKPGRKYKLRKYTIYNRPFMEKMIEQHGSEEAAREYIITLLVKHKVTYHNFSHKMKIVPELNHFPHFSSIMRAFPEIIQEVHRRRGKRKQILFDEFMEQKSKELGSREMATEYLIDTFVKYGVTYNNFSEKSRTIPELQGLPSFSSLARNIPHIVVEIQSGQKKTKPNSVKKFLKKHSKRLGGMKKAEEYIVQTLVKYDVTYHNMKQKKEEIPELRDFPDLTSLNKHKPSIIQEVLRRQGKKSRVSVTQFMNALIEEKGGVEPAEEFIIEMLIKHNVTHKNSTKKMMEIPELSRFPHFSILQKHYPQLIAEMQKRQKKKAHVNIHRFMREMQTKYGGIEAAKEHIISMLVKHNVKYTNYQSKIIELSELNGFPSFPTFRKYYPDIIKEVQRRQQEKEVQSGQQKDQKNKINRNVYG